MMRSIVRLSLFAVFFMLLTTPPVMGDGATVYKWLDSNGNVMFSDKPHPGAQEIQIPNVQTYSAPKIPAPSLPDESKSEVQETAYKISIVQPDEQTTIRNPQGYVSVIVEVKPSLKKGNQVQLLLDDTPVGSPQESTVFALQNILRGSHTLTAKVLNPIGNVLTSSDEVTFYMMPPRVGMVR
jgi:hypothetical protein